MLAVRELSSYLTVLANITEHAVRNSALYVSSILMCNYACQNSKENSGFFEAFPH